MGEGEGRTRGPLEDAKGQPKDPHRSALGAERQVLLHSLNSSMGSIRDYELTNERKEGKEDHGVSQSLMVTAPSV